MGRRNCRTLRVAGWWGNACVLRSDRELRKLLGSVCQGIMQPTRARPASRPSVAGAITILGDRAGLRSRPAGPSRRGRRTAGRLAPAFLAHHAWKREIARLNPIDRDRLVHAADDFGDFLLAQSLCLLLERFDLFGDIGVGAVLALGHEGFLLWLRSANAKRWRAAARAPSPRRSNGAGRFRRTVAEIGRKSCAFQGRQLARSLLLFAHRDVQD